MPETQLPKPSLLLVDDEQVLLRSLARWMRERFEVSLATSSEEALVLLSQRSFDVIISDQRMRGMCGTDFLREVSRKWPHSIRMLMTGHSDLEVASHALLEGHVSLYLKKPLSPEEIERSALEMLAQRRAAKSRDTTTTLVLAQFRRTLDEHLQHKQNKAYQAALLLVASADLASARGLLAETDGALFAEHPDQMLFVFLPQTSLSQVESLGKMLLTNLSSAQIGVASYPAWGVTASDLICSAQGALDVEAGRRVGNKRF